MARRLILDTTVLISAEHGRIDLEQAIADDDDVAIAAITAAELLLGVELASPDHRKAREQFVTEILDTVPVEDYTFDVARAHARLLAHVRRTGQPRGAHDLIIAATAVATSRMVVTADAAARLGELPDVSLLLFER